jgi:hypothetical protein
VPQQERLIERPRLLSFVQRMEKPYERS